ncbi:flagellar biosynthetic protein FliQ, partial [bacterium]|nr:flagellar biosynthetic protein FliQ [bacterium]MBU1918205.1 flagellar biosynthetic protein FliQ [bacterium]
LYLVLILSAPPITAALVVGLSVSIVQATTQIQEQTLTFVPKLVAIILVVSFLGPLGMVKLMQYARSILENFPTYIN